MCLILLSVDIMNKQQREEWDNLVSYARSLSLGNLTKEAQQAVEAADVLIRKLERELQALKHKKAIAAILQKKV